MLGTHQDGGIGVFLKTKKERQENCGDKYLPFLYMMTRYKSFFDLKRRKNKMSSMLNVSNVNNKSEEFRIKDIEMLVDSEEQNWFKRAHV